jgi:iron complex transport system permease protein
MDEPRQAEGGTHLLTRRRYVAVLGGMTALFVAVSILAPLIGPAAISFTQALSDHESTDFNILLRVRVPRVLMAGLVGGALALSGVTFQAILRNPLASPFTLGVSGGAALGAVLAILFAGGGASAGLWIPLAAFAGALAVVFTVHTLAGARRHPSPVTLLLAGVVLNFVCASLIQLVHYYADLTQSFLMVRWMMGSLDVFEYRTLAYVAPVVIAILFVLAYHARALNALSAGPDWARSRGVDVKRLVTLNYFAASLLTGAVVAHSGPIGFVGLIVPHVVRLVLGADHRLLVPCSFLGGGAFLVVCDTFARTALSPVEVPVGIITAVLGGPFFLWLLLFRRRELFF